MPKAAKPQTPGIERKIRHPAMHANATARRQSCKFQDACTFIGRTTTRCVWTSILGPRRVFSISAAQRRQAKLLRGKDSRWPLGREPKTSIRVTARADRYKITPEG